MFQVIQFLLVSWEFMQVIFKRMMVVSLQKLQILVEPTGLQSMQIPVKVRISLVSNLLTHLSHAKLLLLLLKDTLLLLSTPVIAEHISFNPFYGILFD